MRCQSGVSLRGVRSFLGRHQVSNLLVVLGLHALPRKRLRCVGRHFRPRIVLEVSGRNLYRLQQFLECWLLGSLRTFCNFFLKITLKFSVLMLKSQ